MLVTRFGRRLHDKWNIVMQRDEYTDDMATIVRTHVRNSHKNFDSNLIASKVFIARICYYNI